MWNTSAWLSAASPVIVWRRTAYVLRCLRNIDSLQGKRTWTYLDKRFWSWLFWFFFSQDIFCATVPALCVWDLTGRWEVATADSVISIPQSEQKKENEWALGGKSHPTWTNTFLSVSRISCFPSNRSDPCRCVCVCSYVCVCNRIQRGGRDCSCFSMGNKGIFILTMWPNSFHRSSHGHYHRQNLRLQNNWLSFLWRYQYLIIM